MERYRFYPEGAVFFVTFSIVEWLPVFVADRACKLITDSLNFCDESKGLRINAYVIMPTHFHAILFHESFNAQKLETVLTDFRKFTGRQICDCCERLMPRCYAETFRTAAGADRKRRCWQPSRHPVLIESESFWQTKIDYLHENPCRKGFSSASHWFSEGRVDNDVRLSGLQW